MDGKKGCKKGEEVAEEERKGLFIDEGKSSPVLLRGSEQLALVLLMRAITARACSFGFSTATRDLGTRKKWVLTSWATDEAVDVNSLALFGLQYQQHFNDSQR